VTTEPLVFPAATVIITIRYPISSVTEDQALARVRSFVAELTDQGIDASIRVDRWETDG
jgi:hypothetical protein